MGAGWELEPGSGLAVDSRQRKYYLFARHRPHRIWPPPRSMWLAPEAGAGRLAGGRGGWPRHVH